MEKILKTRIFELSMVFGIVLFLFIIPVVSAAFSSDYYAENPATVGPGESRTLNLLRLMSSTNDDNNGSLKYKVELIDGAGIATIEGKDTFSVTPSQPALVPVKLTAPSDVAEGTFYNITFRITDVTPSEGDVGMISFVKTSTVVMQILVKKTVVPETPATTPANNSSMTWIIIVVALIVIIAIVAYLFFRKKKTNVK